MEFNATFLISAISFILFVVIMNTIFYQPVLKIMEERKEFLNNNENITNQANKDRQDYIEKKQTELAQAKTEATTLVAEGSEKLKNENKAIAEDFEQQQKNNVEAQKNEIQKEAENSKNVLHENSKDLSKIIANKVLGVGVKNV